MKIHYVEDEKDLASIIIKYLTKEGFEVTNFSTGEEAIEHIGDSTDLWIIDIMLPGQINGYEIMKKLKENKPNALVIFTSARSQDLDKIIGLEMGSDDYLAKPFAPKELILRVKSILKRSNPYPSYINYNGYEINLEKRQVFLQKTEIFLTNKEFELLLFFLKNKAKAYERDQILRSVWGEKYSGVGRVVDDLLRRLRLKMPLLKIETIYGYGYRLL